MKKPYTITIKGKEHAWSIDIQADPSHVNDWREDGLEIHEVLYSIPEWVVNIGFAKVWVFISDIFNFKNPFKK